MRGYPGVDSQRSTSRSGSWNGSGRSSTKSASENAAVFAPTPNAITRIAVSVKPGLARNDRPARPLLGALAAVGDVVPNAIAAHWEILRHDVRYAGRSLRKLALIHISEPTRLLS